MVRKFLVALLSLVAIVAFTVSTAAAQTATTTPGFAEQVGCEAFAGWALTFYGSTHSATDAQIGAGDLSIAWERFGESTDPKVQALVLAHDRHRVIDRHGRFLDERVLKYCRAAFPTNTSLGHTVAHALRVYRKWVKSVTS